jgi:flagellar basal body-associated protein FliL
MDNVTWPEAIVVLGIIALIIFLIGGGMATYLDMRKMKVTAQQEDDLRQLVRRYEQLAENSLDAQQRAAADVSELRSRTASIEQILRTVE